MTPISEMPSKGVEEARNQLPELLSAAEQGRATLITRHGRPVAVLAPLQAFEATTRQQSLLPLEGTGVGLWGEDSTRTVREMREEWDP